MKDRNRLTDIESKLKVSKGETWWDGVGVDKPGTWDEHTQATIYK